MNTTDELENLNPADQRDRIGLVTIASADELADAIDQAAGASAAWQSMPLLKRGEILATAAGIIRSRHQQYAADLTRENGKTIDEARVEVTKSADFLEYYSGLARLPCGDLLADGRMGVSVTTRREPVGVVAAITPWNDPMLTPARKLSPALLAGNTVLLKPSLDTPRAAQHFAQALHDAGLPTGVLHVLTASDDMIGDHLLADERVAAITLTGSTTTGRLLRRQLADRDVRFQAEMGGKNVAVVMDDADLDHAAATIAAGGYAQAGQRCTATSRVVVHRHVHDALVSRLIELADRLTMGAGSDPSTTIGPLINRRHHDAVLAHIDRATSQGAELVGGGTAPGGDLANGLFIAPAVITNVSRPMAIWGDEVFGPVLTTTAVDDLDAAIAAANDSPYGLSAAIFTQRLADAQRFIHQVDAGQIAVNLSTSGWDVHHPFGGFKASGSAFKEQGTEGLRFYTRVKTAAVGSGGTP